MKRSNRLMLVFGVLLAVVAFGGVIMFGGGSGSAQPAPNPTVKVVTAAADVTLGTALDLTQLGSIDMDVALAVDTYHDPNQLVGMVVRRTVHAGDAFKSSDFQSSAGVDAAQVSANLKAGQVAIALNVDGLTGVGGLIQAGDFVDVILATAVPIVLDNSTGTGGGSGGSGSTGEPFTKVGDVANNTSVKVLVQNVQVLGMGGGAASAAASAANGTDTSSTATDPNTGKPLSTTALVILSVTPQEAEMIRFGQADADAMLSLALRSPADAAAADVKTTGITLRELVDKYGVLPPRAIISQFP